MATIEAVIWGIIQGVTEFIPVSSSGHLVVVPRFFGAMAPDLIFNVALHIGTLVAVLVFFRKDISALFVSEKRLGALILFACLPIVVFGLIFADSIKPLFENPKLTGLMFLVNGAILFICHAKLRANISVDNRSVGMFRALVIGIAQVFAVLPGISRSGITITAGVYLGLDRKDAYKFSFMLFIPTALLALLYSLQEAASSHYVFNINMLIGGLFAAISGFAALKILFNILAKAKLHLLGLYSLLLGVLVLVFF